MSFILIFLNCSYPWDRKLNNKKKLEVYKNTLKKELNLDPTSKNISNNLVAKKEIIRLLSIYKSLKNFGYSKKFTDFTPIRGNLLKCDDKFVVLIRHGEHRISCLPKIGINKVEVWIRSCDIYDFSLRKYNYKDMFDNIYNGKLTSSPLTNCYGYFFFKII